MILSPFRHTCFEIGFQVFHEMVNAGVEPNIHTYGALIDGCAKAGQVAKAFGAYGFMRSKVCCCHSSLINFQ